MGENGQDRWLLAAIDALDASVFVKDRDLRFLFVNKGFERALGRSRAEVIGRRATDLVPPDAAEKSERSDREALTSGQPSRVLIALGDRTFASIKTPIPGPDGTMQQLVGVSIEVTESLALEQRNALLAAAIQSSGDAIMTFDGEGRVTSANEAARCFLGAQDEASILGRHVSAVDSAGHRGEVVFRQALAGEVVQFDAQQPEDLGQLWAFTSTRASPIQLADGTVAGVVLIVRDVSEARRAQLRQRDLADQLAHRDRLQSLGQLAGGIAHDFNNLLAIVGLSAEQLMEGAHVDATGREGLAQIRDVAARGRELTAQLLAIARKDESAVAPVDLGDVVRTADALLARTLGEHVVRVLELTNEPTVVVGRRARLEQVLLNLALNARDAMPLGGTLTLRTEHRDMTEADVAAGRTQARGPHVLLTVADTGSGMDAETLRHALEPFFTTKKLGSGTGLGLATVHGVVTQARGGVWVDSTPGEGTRVCIALPLAAVQTAADDHPARVSVPSPRPRTSGLVAVVEDEPALRAVTALMLENAGYRVAVFGDGDSLLAELPALAPDVLLSDVVLPGLSGPTTAERARALLPGLRVVLTSGYTAGLIDDERPGDLHPELLGKPYTAAELLDAIERART